MLAALLLQAAAPQTAVDAERAFNAMAQAKGQWTAFRAFAAEDAMMFVPQPVKAQAWLKGRKDPTASVEWWPTASYVSCDGKTAANTGGWRRPDGSVGYFTTIWQQRADGRWMWRVDHGDVLQVERSHPAEPSVLRSNCGGAPVRGYVGESISDPEEKSEVRNSADASLIWEWHVTPDGARTMTVSLWTGTAYEAVIADRVAAPK